MQIAFELGISLGEIAKVRFSRAEVPKLDDAFTWFVRVDDKDAVTIHALYAGSMREIARARWRLGRLLERTSTKPGFPSEQQWKLVATALGRVRRRAYENAPAWRRLLAQIDPATRPILLGSIIVAFAAIGIVVMIFLVRSKDPVRTARLAPYDKLVWSDVAGGGETTVPLILKDPERERGRKVCVTGTVDAIERADVEGRKVHVGTLRTPQGDALPFIALGSTRSIVTREAGQLCGIANGKHVVGLFDLPENRAVER